MKPLVIYHDSCADGFGAAFAAWLKLGDEAEYFPCQYGERANSFDTQQWYDRDVYILDFSFPKMIMDSIMALAKKVVWLDHHATSKFDMASFTKDNFNVSRLAEGLYPGPWEHVVIHNDNKSGALLAWEYFHPDTEVPMFIKHIDDYDRWQFKIEGTKAFNKALWSYAPWSFEQWQYEWDSTWGYSTADGLEGMPNFIREGEAILRAHNQNVESVVKGGARKCSIHKDGPLDDGDIYTLWQKDGLSANCPPHLQSDVGHELANQSGTYGLLWYIDKDNRCKCSLRSNGDYDVSAIAKAFGGGGHRNAAGFQIDIQTLLRWLK